MTKAIREIKEIQVLQVQPEKKVTLGTKGLPVILELPVQPVIPEIRSVFTKPMHLFQLWRPMLPMFLKECL